MEKRSASVAGGRKLRAVVNMALHYVEAGKILDRMFAPGAKPFSLKKMLYANPEKKVSLGVVYALISETLKCTFQRVQMGG